MSDILEQLNRRLERKRSEIPTQGSDEAPASEPAPAPSPPEPPPAIETFSDYDGDEDDIALVFAPDGTVAHLLGDAYRPRRGLARMRAEKADVVVLNHALLAFNLVLDHQLAGRRHPRRGAIAGHRG